MKVRYVCLWLVISVLGRLCIWLNMKCYRKMLFFGVMNIGGVLVRLGIIVLVIVSCCMVLGWLLVSV